MVSPTLAEARKEGIRTRNGLLPSYTRDWDPVERHTHCSNCLHCVVSDGENEPMVGCEMGVGRQHDDTPKPLLKVIRPYHPYSFAAASKCPKFTCMTDGCDEHKGV